MARVILENVSKVFPGNVEAVKDVNLHVADREFMVLVGPSGCGKSTTLRIIAGLEDATTGTVIIGEQVVNDVPPRDRDVAMVFQNYALYPHMTVYKNMAFGLKLRKYPRDEIDARVQDVARMLGITHLIARMPGELSGGERQRVAMGRAIVRHPKAFLFDEPLSNLDAKLRVEMRAELKKLHQRLESTMIYVTHDQVEAMTLGERIAVQNQGIIHQIDDPLTLYHHPADSFVAGFIGTPSMNFFQGTLVRPDKNTYFDEGSTRIKLPARLAAQVQAHINREVTFGIRPEDVTVGPQDLPPTEGAGMTVRINVVEPLGHETILYLSTPKQAFLSKVESRLRLEAGAQVQVTLNLENAHLFDPGSGKNLTLGKSRGSS